MASNRLTRNQVEWIFKKGKVYVGFEPMKVSDVIEILNHKMCVDYMREARAALSAMPSNSVIVQ